MFKGNSILDDEDLQSLYGRKAQDSDNYLQTLSSRLICTSLQPREWPQVQKSKLEWELFEKGFRNGSARESLKEKAPLMQQDIVLVPCNPGLSKHWFLLEKENQIVPIIFMGLL